MVCRLAVLLGSAALLLPLAEPVGPRTGAVARYLLAMAAMTMATPAQAQAVTTLVTNGSEPVSTNLVGAFQAQAFTTGDNAAGYRVTAVQIGLGIAGERSILAVIREDNGGEPGELVATLTNPTSFTNYILHTFTAPEDTALEANTTYWLSIHEGVSERIALQKASSPGETGLAGWSIADNHLRRFQETGLPHEIDWDTVTGEALRISIRGYAVDVTAPSFDSATVNDDSLTITFDEALDTTKTPATAAFNVQVDGSTVTVSTVAVSDSTVTLTLATAVTTGQSVTVAYTKPDSGDVVQDESGNELATFTAQTVTNVTRPTNTPATGAPTISGTARVGEELTASTSEIMDDNGITGATFEYQWVRDDGTDEEDIDGATLSTYRVTSNDGGATLKVKVSFTDDDGFDEEVVSDPTATIDTTAPEVEYLVPTSLTVGMGVVIPPLTEDDDIASYSATGLPDWLTINATTGLLTGTIPDTGSLSFTTVVTVTDTSGNSAEVTLIFPTVEVPVVVADTTPPTVVSANLFQQNRAVSLILSEATTFRNLASNNLKGAFTVTADGEEQTILLILSTNGESITINLSENISSSAETVVLSYDQSEAGDDALQDSVGNRLASFRWAIRGSIGDTTAPTLTSIERQTPATSPTNADSLTWRVTFSEAVENVDTADFTVSGSTATVTGVQAVSGETGVYDVTASGGNLAGYTGTVTLEFASSQNIADAADNALASPTLTGTGNSYEVDNTAPTVTIDVPATSSAAFPATITFSEAVSGFTETDITAVNGTLSGFTPTTPDTVWTVQVTPAADGQVTLQIGANVATDAAGNANTAAAPATSIYTAPDTAAPTVTSIERQTPTTSPTNRDSLTWRVTFSEAVENVDTADFTVSGSTATVTNVQPVSDETGVYDVTVSGGNLADYTGTVTLEFAGGQDIQDEVGNRLTTTLTGTGNSYEVDNTAPTVMIGDVPPTSDGPFTATISFSEAVSGFTGTDITAVNGTLSGFTPTTTNTAWTVQVTPAADGQVTLQIGANVATDAAGNANTAAAPATSIYTAPDTAAPTVTSIERQTPATSPTNVDSLTWRVTFSEAVENVDTADFTVSGGSTATVTGVQPVGGETDVYDVTASGGDLAGYTGTVTLEFAGGQNIQDAVGNALANTNLTGTGNSYDVDNTAPTVTVGDVPPTSDGPFTATISFSEAVSGFTGTDITAVNGALSGFTPTTPDTVWTVQVTPAADGQVTLQIGANVATDAAGNANTAAAPATSIYTAPDTAAPTVTSIERQTPATSPTNVDSLTWRVTFSEAVENVDTADFTVSGSTATVTNVQPVSGETGVYDVTVSGGNLADYTGTVTLEFAGGQDIQDEAGNALATTNLTGTSNSYDVDNTAPTVMIGDVPPTSDGPFPATITFSEAVSGFTGTDITAVNGTLSGFTSTTTNTVWTVQVTPAADGQVTLQIGANVATDAAGNANTAAAPATSIYTAPDTAAPTVTSIERQTPATSPTNRDSLTWRVTFSEAVENVDTADFTVSGSTATVTNVQPVSGETGVYDVTVSGGNLADYTGTVTLEFAGGQNIQDEAGNALATTSLTGTDNSYEVDNTAPTVTIGDVPPTSDGPFTATITFSEAVSGFTESDITAGNSALSGFTPTTPDTVWVVQVMPAADGDVTLQIGANVATDTAGNANTAAAPATSIYTAPDTAAPTVASVERQTPATSPTNADTLTWRVTFSEAVENVDTADFTVSGSTATVTNVQPVGGETGVHDVTVSGGDLAGYTGTVTLEFAGGQNIQDAAGNALANTNLTGTDNSYEVDNTAPTVTIDVPATSSAAFPAAITFSEAVSGFTETDITAGNGTLSGFTSTTTNTVWTVQVTPAADGQVTLQIGANVATDAAGNANTAAAPATSIYTAPDTAAPTVISIERQTPATSPTNADSLTWRVTFSEAVENVDTADFTVSGGSTATVTNVQPVGGETDVYDVTVSGGDLAGYTGTVTLEFAGGQNIQDAVGNALANTNLTGTDNSYEVDNTAPTVTIDVPATSSAAFPAAITFSEAVSGFTETDITAESGTLSDFTPTTPGTVWTVQVTPAADGQVTLEIGANVATDAAGNANTAAAPASSTYTALDEDTVAPRVTSITRQDPDTSPTNGDSLMWRVVFSEAVVNVDDADFEVSGTSATLNVLKVTGQTVTWDVTVSGGDLASLDGTVTLSFAADQDIADEADNALDNTTPTITDDNSYELDNTAPMVTITDVPPTSDGPFTATISFSEVVSGFGQSDITAANGTLSTFEPVTTDGTTPGTVWTVLVTPTADGAVTLEIEANVAQDTAGNGNTAASPAGSTYTAPDTTLPHVISITRQTPATSPTNADSLTWRLVFSETVANVDSTDFVVTGTTATLSVAEVTSQTGAWDVTVSGGDLADKNGTVTLSFAADQDIADEADNALDNTTPTITDDNSYELDNTAPMVEITDVPPTSDGPFTATISFSEAVSGFGQGDITAANGTLSTFEPVTTDGTTASTVWTVLVTPTADGAVTLEIEANVVQNMVGSGNMAASPATSIYTAPDTTAPTVTSITRQTPATSPTNADSLTWRVVFSETVANVDSTDFVVTGTTATLSVAEVTSQTGAWDVTVSGGDLADKNGMVTLSFAPDQDIADEADNTLASTSPTLTNHNSYELNNTAPMVEITDVPPTSDGPFTVTISFSEAVSGFAQGDITAVNGTLSTFEPVTTDGTTPGTIWTVLVTPTANGAVTLEIEANVVQNMVGNGNMAAAPATSIYTAPDTTAPTVTSTAPDTTAPTVTSTAPDTTAPTVTSIERQTPATSPTNADSLTWRVVFSETVANVDSTDFVVTGTTATLSVAEVTSQTGVWGVTASSSDPAGKNGMVTLAFAPGQDIADEAGNELTNTQPTLTSDNSYMMDNTPPMVAYTSPDSLVVGTAVTAIEPSTADTDIASFRATGLPAGLVIDPTTGVISGSPVMASADPSMVVVTVTDTSGNSTIVRLTLLVGAAAQPGVSVAPTDPSLNEGSTTSYTVTLNTLPAGPVTITPTTGDSGAVSVSPVSLTFTPSNWDTSQTVSVTAVVDDDTDDETVTISHSVSGYGLVTTAAAVTVSVTDTDEHDATQDDAEASEAAKEAEAVLKEVVLPDVVQQLTAQTTEAITSRLNSIASGAPLGAPLTLNLGDVVADTVAFFHGERERLKNGSLEWRQVVSGRDFAFPLSALTLAQGEGAGEQEGSFSSLAIWGGGDYSSYGNIIDGTDVDGNGFSGTIGVDMQPIPQLVTGLALTTSRWGLDYATDGSDGSEEEGTYDVDVTVLNPYLNWLATEQLSLWATFGYGRGEAKHTPDGGNSATPETDSFTSWAGGLRFELLPGVDPLTGEGSPLGLAFKVDGGTSSFLDTQVQLARLAAEVSRSFLGEAGLLTAALDLGWNIRSVSDKDEVDGQRQRIVDTDDGGGGAELAGSLNWLNTDGSVSATVDTRVLFSGGDHREWGIGGHLRFAPSRRDGEGLSLTLQPSFGVTDTRLDELWSLSGNDDLAISTDRPGARLDARLAYGFPLGNALLTPYTKLAWEETTSAYGAGLRYGINRFLELDLKGAHHRRANGNDENRFSLDMHSQL